LPDIRVVQDGILERARRFEVPIVENSDLGRTITTVMELIFASAGRLEAVASGGSRG
jgi:2-phosphoglycerate kinase